MLPGLNAVRLSFKRMPAMPRRHCLADGESVTLIIRPDLDQYFMEIATVVAKRSTCLRNQVGALFVKNKRILSTGYNGAPSGLDHCDLVGCARENVASGTRHATSEMPLGFSGMLKVWTRTKPAGAHSSCSTARGVRMRWLPPPATCSRA